MAPGFKYFYVKIIYSEPNVISDFLEVDNLTKLCSEITIPLPLFKEYINIQLNVNKINFFYPLFHWETYK